jgi:hypothetical protein|tara:strand:+ start:3042 stop:4586 length:1545 start_codon:yes stop_codon:yes gene_type:complete
LDFDYEIILIFKIKKMKKYILTMCLMVAFISCDDGILDQKNPNTLTADSFWKTESDAQKGIVAAYSPFSHIYFYSRLWFGYTLSQSDEIAPRPDYFYSHSIYNVSPGDGNFTAAWGEIWKVIFRANQVLKNVPEIEMDEVVKNNILGEAYFLRAYTYFTLVNYWLNVPLVTEPASSLAEVLQPQAAPDEVWAQIESDLNNAIPKLPNSYDADNLGRITAGAAAAMLGKVYLYRQKWSEAATQLKRVIDQEFATYDLVSNYSENFRLEGENNIESLFEIQFDDAFPLFGGGWGADIKGTARNAAYAHDLANGQAKYVNSWVLPVFLAETTNSGEIDPRAYETILWDYPGAEYFDGTLFKDKITDYETEIRAAKYLDVNGGGPAPAMSTCELNMKIIRFADVLLMYAEAENEANGPSANAYGAIDRVRARADMPGITAALNQSEFRERVRNERVLELTLESHRPLDLKRWGMLPGRIIDNPEMRFGNTFYVEGREYFPIPQVDIDTNPLMIQNKGW